MADCNELADYQWLTSGEAAALTAELAGDDLPLHTAIGRLREHLPPARTHLLLELVELRRRAAAKFADADRMFFTPLGLEQATDQWVAAYKASRFERAGSSPVPATTVMRGSPDPARGGSVGRPATTENIADLCCGIGGDLLALARRAGSSSTPTTIVGVDLNPVMTHIAAANVQVVLSAEDAAHVSFYTGDVESFDLRDFTAWHIDPDRRPNGRRTTSLDWSSPNRTALEQMLAVVPNAAIKLAPATDVPVEWAERCELEWISRDRECRQLVAWHGALAQLPGLRRATLLTNAARGLAPRSLVGAPNQRLLIAPRINRYVFDPDPAVRAARLTGALAAEHELSAITAGPTYLTGPQPITDPALACFEVLDVLPLRTRSLADYLREHGIGRVEIKTRGVEIDPQQLRRDLKLRDDESATLLLTSIGRRQLAIVAKRA